MNLKKRKWIYINNPVRYDIRCNKCNGTHIEWSEYEHLIWCFDCEEDLPGTAGIFDGPIPLEISELFGISFNRYYIKSKKVFKPVITKKGFIVYRYIGNSLKYLK